MPNAVEIKDGVFANYQIRFIFAPKLQIVGKNAFAECYSLVCISGT